MTEFHREIKAYTATYFDTKISNEDFTRRIGDLQIGSLDLVEFVMALEEKFGIEVTTDQIDQDMSLEQLCEMIARAR